MATQLLLIQLLLVGILCVLLLNKYGNLKKQHKFVLLLTFIGWYCSFIIIFILPLDIGITFYHKCVSEAISVNLTKDICELPKGFVNEDVLYNLWRIVYWTSQFLTWIILPLMQKYSTSANFTVTNKLKSAVYENAVYYFTYFFIFIFCLIYGLSKGLSLNWEHLKTLAVTTSNTWGLFFLIVLLGYGLVEVPRRLWLICDSNYRLNKLYFDLVNISQEKCQSEETTKEIYKEAKEVISILRNDNNTVLKAKEIMSKFSSELVKEIHALKSQTDYASLGVNVVDKSVIQSDAYLIKLNSKVIETVQNYNRSNAKYSAIIKLVHFLEDVEKAKNKNSFHNWKHPYFLNKYMKISPKWLEIWYTVVKPWLIRFIAFISTTMTLIIIWSECTFFIASHKISLAALILSSVAEGSHYKYVQLLCIILISYLCTCVYFSLFKLKIYKYYHLDSNHQTDENSLLFSAILLCRLTPPLCLNFLGMIHMDSHVMLGDNHPKIETQFTKLMGHLDVLPLIGKGKSIYMPLTIVFFCVATYLRIGSKFLNFLGIDQFMEDYEITLDNVKMGSRIADLERSNLEKTGKKRNLKSGNDEKFLEVNESDTVATTETEPLIIPDTTVLIDLEKPDSPSLIEFNDNDKEKSYFTPQNIFDDL
uniref:LMBR1 domain-containing protein 2 n=1 Tax=Strongyloides papillosus TaxID=174720 RepID=A0A0N5BUF0_STREA